MTPSLCSHVCIRSDCNSQISETTNPKGEGMTDQESNKGMCTKIGSPGAENCDTQENCVRSRPSHTEKDQRSERDFVQDVVACSYNLSREEAQEVRLAA